MLWTFPTDSFKQRASLVSKFTNSWRLRTSLPGPLTQIPYAKSVGLIWPTLTYESMTYGRSYNEASDTGRQSGQGQTSLLSFLKGRKAAGRSAGTGSSSPAKYSYPEAYDCELNEEVGQ
jgi:hypothetical protein